MTDDRPDTDALEAIDRVIDVLRQEIRGNPCLAHRIVEALGAVVSFDSELAKELINPRRLVSDHDEETARAQLAALSLSDLKTLAKRANLATPTDLKGLKKTEAVAMIYARARAQAEARGA